MARADVERKWRRRLERCAASGLPVVEFCHREGVSTASFYSWRRRLGEATTPKSALEFVEVAMPSSSSSIEIVVGDVVVRVPAGVSAEDLRVVLAVVTGAR
jgi:transposase-like protein